MSKLFRQLKEAALRRTARRDTLLSEALQKAEAAREEARRAQPGMAPAPGALPEPTQSEPMVRDPVPPPPEVAALRRARAHLDPRRRVTLSRGTIAVWGLATAVLAAWEIARWQAPRAPEPHPFVKLFSAQERRPAAAQPRDAEAPAGLRLDYSIDVSRRGAAARSSPRGPAPSR